MGHVYRKKNLTYFDTKHNLLLAVWKYPTELNQKQLGILKKDFLVKLRGK